MTLSIEDATRFAQVFKGLVDGVSVAVLDKRQAVRLALTTMFAGGHLLLEDAPGTGKTALARAISAVIDGTHSRIQFTPDLLPSDITGVNMFNQKTGEWVFHAGPVFAEIVLADEINRASPKTQSALLEVMEEAQVTVDGVRRPAPQPFMVIATQNPVEQAGTYPLPEAQLDRFLLRLSFGYPSPEQEWDVVARRIRRRQEEQSVQKVLDAEGLLSAQQAVETVHVEDTVGHYAVELVTATRDHSHALVGASPRGTLALITCARALAVIRGRDYVVPEDVKALAHPALDHRVTVKPELWLQNATGAGVVEAALHSVAVPAAEDDQVRT